MRKKIYISGKITGLDYEVAKHKFDRAEEHLKELDFIVVNPMILPKGLSYSEYMDIDITMLSICDAIYMLNNYESSKGAVFEKHFAKDNNIQVLYEGSE